MAVLSNGWNPLQARKAERAGFRGPVLVSSEIGVQKPAPRAFETLLASARNASAATTWYVGDDPHGDVAGAQPPDCERVWIDWETQGVSGRPARARSTRSSRSKSCSRCCRCACARS